MSKSSLTSETETNKKINNYFKILVDSPLYQHIPRRLNIHQLDLMIVDLPTQSLLAGTLKFLKTSIQLLKVHLKLGFKQNLLKE